jgi:hypothetical protein
MKAVSIIVGVVGLLVAILAAVGRFHGPPSVTAAGCTFAASHVLLAANTVLLVAVWLAVLGQPEKK